jgi:hypothetical protein
MKIFRSARRGSLRAVISSTRGAIDLASIMTGVLVLGIIGGVIAATVFAVIPGSQDNAAKGNLATVGTAERAVQTTGATIFLKYDSASTDHLALEASRLGGIQHPNQRLIVDTNAYGTQYLAAQLSQTGQVWLSTSEDPTPRAAVDAGFVLASYTGGPGTTVSALAIPDSLLVPAGIASAAPQAMIHALVTRTRYFAVPGITPSELTVSTFSGSMNTATVDYGGPVVQAVQDAGYADLVGLHIRLAVDAGTVDGTQPTMESISSATGDSASAWTYQGTSVVGSTRYFDYVHGATLVPDPANAVKQLFGFRMSFALVSPAPAGSMPPPPTAVPIHVIVGAASTITYNPAGTPPCAFSANAITC